MNTISIYPNPITNTLNINGINKSINYGVFNPQEQMLIKGNLSNTNGASSLA